MNAGHEMKHVLPRIILHNTISLDGSLKGFNADLNIHYSIASSLKVDAYLVGSQTILDASDEIPPPPENKESVKRIATFLQTNGIHQGYNITGL